MGKLQVLSNPGRIEPRSSSVAPEFVAETELADALLALSTPFVPNADRVLFRQGDMPTALYLVKKGEVALALESEGRIVICVRAGAGSLVGLPAIVGNKPYTLTAAPCGDADICQVSRKVFAKFLAENPGLSMKVLQVLAAEIRLARRAMMDLAS
ncbi:MAG TPA: Crp/Fnr family transcriptional regulator [Terracidiphilus sp.]|nr:Crp/Fnr family transcriptional regulator [Terracidiphilus sp.]